MSAIIRQEVDAAQARYRQQGKPVMVNAQALYDKQPPHALETECALLGSIVLESGVMGDVVDVLNYGPVEFYKPSHSVIYEVLLHLFNHNKSVDVVTISERLRHMQQLENIGGIDYIVMLAESVPSAASASFYAKIVHEKYLLRCMVDHFTKGLYRVYHSTDPIDEQLDTATAWPMSLQSSQGQIEATTAGSILQDAYDHLQTNEGVQEGIQTGFHELDEILGGGLHSEYVIVAARPSMGKAQPLDAKVLTPTGFKPMGMIQEGVQVIGGDGKPCRVIGVYPQGVKQVYRVQFIDGGSTECCFQSPF